MFNLFIKWLTKVNSFGKSGVGLVLISFTNLIGSPLPLKGKSPVFIS